MAPGRNTPLEGHQPLIMSKVNFVEINTLSPIARQLEGITVPDISKINMSGAGGFTVKKPYERIRHFANRFESQIQKTFILDHSKSSGIKKNKRYVSSS